MATRPPPLLLTKRLTSFLHLNLSATITTLLLLTPSGKLLAYASRPSIPIATLRTHATVAASLYAIHRSGTDRETIDAALGGGTVHHPPARRTAGAAAADDDDGPLAVTIQLESGSVLVIRRLRCGMLFVCMGPPDHPPPPPAASSRPQTQHQQHGPQHQQSLAGAISQSAASSGPGGNNNSNNDDTSAFSNGVAAAQNGHQTPSTSPRAYQHAAPLLTQQQQHHSSSSAGTGVGTHPGSPSEAASVLSAATAQTSASSVVFGAGTAGVMAMRRHAEELARWLDDKLGSLEVPGDGLGGVL